MYSEYPMYSDRDKKDDIRPLLNAEALELFNLKPVAFRMKGGTKKQFGFIAQDVEQTRLENIVFKDALGFRTIAYNQLIPLLVHQIQELTKRVERLERGAVP